MLFLVNFHETNNNSYAHFWDSIQISKFNMNVWIVNEYSHLLEEPHKNMVDVF